MQTVIIFLLILLTGIFAMVEMALLTSRQSALENEAKKGDKQAEEAIKLKNNPDVLLSSIQFGFTLMTIVTGVLSGDQLTDNLAVKLADLGWFGEYSSQVATIIIVTIVTYFTLVFGELVPKKIGLTNAIPISKKLARPMQLFINLTKPFVRILSASTSTVIRLIGIKPNETQVTEDEIKAMIQEGASVGNIEIAEQEIVNNVFMLGDRRVSTLMTPRYDIEWVDIEDDYKTNIDMMYQSKHNAYPVCREEIDNVLGMIYLKDVFTPTGAINQADFEKAMVPPFYIHENVKAYKALDKMKENKVHNALVVDEYGVLQGIVTISDFITVLVGDTPEIDDVDTEYVKNRNENSWFIDGAMPFAEFVDDFDLENVDLEEHDDYNTLAGFMLHLFGEIPTVGDSVDWQNFKFEIADMDQKRIDKLLVTREEIPESTEEGEEN